MKFYKLIILFVCLWANIASAADDMVKTDFHVFLEGYATNPALSQMIEYVQLPQSFRKIIAWHRFPRRRRVINLEMNNTREVDLPIAEGYYSECTRRALKATLEEMEKHPELNLVLHANLDKMDIVIRPFLEKIPKERIKMIHLYEDGYGELFKNKLFLAKNRPTYTDEELKDALDKKRKWEPLMIYSLNRFYPVTYHLFGWRSIIRRTAFDPMRAWLKDCKIEDIDFDRIKNKLTDDQKKMLYRLSGFDYDYYSNLMKDKKSVMFVMGYHFKNEARKQAERNLLRRLRNDDSFTGFNAKDYLWLYKPHPSYSAKDTIPVMQKNFPDMIEIPAQIPFEIFIIADLKPTWTVGYSSSLFYALHEPDILYMVRRNSRDTYLPFLTEVRHLGPKKILDLSDFMDTKSP